MLNLRAVSDPAVPRRAWRRTATALGAAIVALASFGAAQAQTFRLPKQCTTATGDDGDDPVVLISIGTGEKNFTNFRVFSLSKDWAIEINPATANTYNIYTTYTPFLTSDGQLVIAHSLPAQFFDLPYAGNSGGRAMKIWADFTVTIMNTDDKTPVPNAYVDFIPAFVGSSPYTMQANGQGVVELHCVQQVSSGYRITVYDSSHKYLYDGAFLTNGTSAPRGRGSHGSARTHADQGG